MESKAALIPRRNFDGLFLHALKPTGAFARALREAGYDPETQCEHYPLPVWRAALNVAREHVYPDVPVEEALRRLGHQYVEGFARTPVGFIFASAAQELGTERLLARIPSYLRAGREDMRMRLDAVHAREWRAFVEDVDPLPDFVAGAVEAVLLFSHAQARVDVVDHTATGYTLRIRW